MQITSNITSIKKYINNVPNQLNHGIAIGLNKTAEHIRESELKAVNSIFTIRGNWWKPKTVFGFNVKYAKKNDQSAEIFTRADWLNLHVTGGIKTPKGNNLALPTNVVKRNKKDIITRSNRPKNIKGSFKINVTTKTGKHLTAIAKKVGRGKNKKLVIMYWLERNAKIKKEYDFYEIGKKVFDRNVKIYINEGIEQSFRTAR